MKYADALHYLLQQLPMFQRVGAAAYRTDLTNITQLCQLMGNPQQHLKCIHVAGTNGKGSVTHLIASVLQQQGYKVGVFVSPHYKDYRERIKINGQYITRPFVTRFVAENQQRFKSINASFFEISTVMAFEYFKQRKVDFAVIETGMGGRLDSTNIITPLLSVITNIGFDHTQFLGNTLPKIAAEKAGIIKPNIPVVIGEATPETKPVFTAKAKSTGSVIYFARKAAPIKGLPPFLQTSFQQKNIATALKALQVLQKGGVKLSARAIANGIKNVAVNTAFIGRWMVQHKRPFVVFDSAHNEAGLSEVFKEMKKLNPANLHIVYGTVNDKELAGVFKQLPQKAQYYFCQANIPRALNSNLLTMEAKNAGLSGNDYRTVKAAYRAALKNAGRADAVLVTGSIFIVAELL